ncbi:hypothetical protein SLEP1_g29084 [Rubroshorea leprosula]|uniref:Uncharacterized protein n=1 Tax=Rubroshorea leprosula TaxID=152421 RepID=A0AAV5K7J5_9ROSI|nr:hypothetical protein SLEP1_g29084 [Rubroshorea leprosula]
MLGSQGRLLGFAFLANPAPGFARNPSVLGSQGRLPGLALNPAPGFLANPDEEGKVRQLLGSCVGAGFDFSIRTYQPLGFCRCWVRNRTQ